MVQFDEEKQTKRIEELRKKEEEDLAKILSPKYGVQYIDLLGEAINTDGLRLIPEKIAREKKMAVFDILGKKIKVAVLAPTNPEVQAVVKDLETRGYITEVFMVSTQSLEKAWSRYKDLSYATETSEGVLSIKENGSKENNIEKTKNELNDIILNEKTNKVSKLFDAMVANALALNASDIHIEPEEEITIIRFRLDGVLTKIVDFEHKVFDLLVSRIKLTAGLKINIKNNSQDGRFSIKMGDKEIEVRTSTMPGAYGESIVMRLLNPESISVPIEELGIEPNLLAVLQREINKPNGMILNTGPTGSGKTTTLYAFLNKVNSPDIKIITIEDPIEYHLAGITQTQTDKEKGYTFAQGLRSALRQDPDVIMVGEIRDLETAEIAINSALTGHLVLSTLHTNTAAGTFPRFIDIGVNPKILGSAINVAMAQRLVRILCVGCKKEVPLEGKEKVLVDNILGQIQNIEKYEIRSRETMFVPVGCDKCNFTGYKGRKGIFEAILMDQEIEELVKENPSEREIKKVARKQGLLDMREDGIIKVLNGKTSLDELGRVVELEE